MKTGNVRFQRGVFSIEATFAFLLLSIVLLFVGGISAKIQVLEQAERVSFALVNLLKERTRFYGSRQAVTEVDANQLYTISTNLLSNHSSEDIGLVVESYYSDTAKVKNRGMSCSAKSSISTYSALVPKNLEKEDEPVVSPIYQVTVCIRASGQLYRLVELIEPAYGLVYTRSSSVIPGR